MESLQTELIMDILSRVPTLDLLKLTSVCRRWRNIILNDPLFRRLHHACVMSNPNQNLVLLVKRGPDLYWVDSTDKASPRQVAISLPRIPKFSDYQFVGSCNGLLCLVNPNCQSILVINPFIGQYVVIPMPQEFPFLQTRLGFGFDEVTKSFKVVGIFPRGGWLIYNSVKVAVYDLGNANGINWRSILVTNFPPACTMGRTSCFFNGRLHWTYWTQDKYVGIISFDLAVEEFIPIPTPGRPLFRKMYYDYPIVLKGCLCILKIRKTEAGRPELLIWVMKEYGIKASWELELDTYPFIFRRLNPNFYGFKVLGLGKDGELIVLAFNTRSRAEDIFLSSDLTREEFKRLQLERQPYTNGSIIHTATLNWI